MFVSLLLKDLRAVPSIHFSPEIKTWVAVSSGFLLLLAADVLRRLYLDVQHWLFISDGQFISSMSWLLASITIIPVAGAIYRKWTRGCLSEVNIKRTKAISIGMLSGVTLFCLFILFIQFKPVDVQEDYSTSLASYSRFLRASSIYELLIFYIAIDILRPILEEIVFRGFIFQSIAKKYGLLLGIFVSSASFGIIHSGLFSSTGLVFLFGAVSCMLVYLFRNLSASYSLHITYNSLITLFGFMHGA